MNLLLIFLLIGLSFLFIFFVFLYLKKDQELTMLTAQYAQLNALEKMEESRIEKREDFMAMVVHELRSPLAVIQGSADLVLKNDDRLQKEQKDVLLTQIKTSTADLLKLVNNLLDVAKMESGRFEVNTEEGDINDLLRDEVEYYMALARQKEIDVQMEMDEKTPRFFFDKDRMKQVMNNLLSNALKFTPNKGVVKVSSKTVGDELVKVCVEDTGPGVPDEMKQKLFHMFVQIRGGQGHKDDGKMGSGLGLAIAKGIVDAHDGSVWVEDNVPAGARFCFTIPLLKNSL